ncbi:MAG: citrate lyase holo-[acyl-carrier protein] synthase [Eubacteriales bacterium]|nr:citrate lyase holo-[acyl-carrier protein] synthase [Eubacteriales bacterium]
MNFSLSGRPQVTVGDMAAAREARAAKQRQMLQSGGMPLVCLTMNIAGPEKINGLIRQAFEEGMALVLDMLNAHHAQVTHREEQLAPTGPEAFFCVQGDPRQIKGLTVRIEDRDSLGRLLDIDVLGLDGTKVSRADIAQPPRRCLLCGEPVVACARSRRHSAGELFAAAMGLVRAHFERLFAEDISSFAVRALLTELAATPKPGMVDRANSGAHGDMDFFTFLDSAAALAPYFHACARMGVQAASPGECFESLRAEGALAEGRMLRVTGGANTHRGAVFSLGILCAASGIAWSAGKGLGPETLSSVAARMSAPALKGELEGMKQAHTYGETLMKGRLAGARAEAADGFPTALRIALPRLDEALAEGRTLNDACIRALMAIMAVAEDSVLLRRAGPERSEIVRKAAAELLGQGCPEDGMTAFDRQCMMWNISFGGSADLLAAALFLRLARGSRWNPGAAESRA